MDAYCIGTFAQLYHGSSGPVTAHLTARPVMVMVYCLSRFSLITVTYMTVTVKKTSHSICTYVLRVVIFGCLLLLACVFV